MKTGAGRLLFADWLRAWALLVMIETHVFNAFLGAEFRYAQWFRSLNFLNGLVAPSFLFVSGFVFMAASQKRMDKLRSYDHTFWRQVRRIATVWGIGYAMHLPSYSVVSTARGVTASEWTRLFQVDVLHCIAVTWLFMLVTMTAIRSEAVRNTVWSGAAMSLAAFAPWAWSKDFQAALPAPLAAYLNSEPLSLFPVFPWSAFMLAGALCASWFVKMRAKGKEQLFMAGLAAAGAALCVVGGTLPVLRFLPAAAGANWRADPRSFLLRLGLVLLSLAACWLYGLRHAPSSSPLLDLSRESLVVYMAHLLIIYGPLVHGSSLAALVGWTQGPLVCGVVSVALAAAMTVVAKYWSQLETRRTA
jgi:uncharacterized membrane protein